MAVEKGFRNKMGVLFVVREAMADLIKKIGTAEGLLIFTFTKIYTVRGTLYFISVFGKQSQHFFHMEYHDSQWKIVDQPKPPDWVLQHEEELADFLEQNHSRDRT